MTLVAHEAPHVGVPHVLAELPIASTTLRIHWRVVFSAGSIKNRVSEPELVSCASIMCTMGWLPIYELTGCMRTHVYARLPAWLPAGVRLVHALRASHCRDVAKLSARSANVRRDAKTPAIGAGASDKSRPTQQLVALQAR
jgi:hypothetical protein